MNRLAGPVLAAGLLASGLGGGTAAPPPAAAQCMPANPSFELAGSAGAVFAGWSQFGAVGSSTIASHGAKAARVSGPNTGTWDVSGFWQGLDCAPGQAWTVAVRVRALSSRPLTGGARAIVNVEWRTAQGGLIDYESHTAAEPASPCDSFLMVRFETGAAPAGTAQARLLLGVLQGPTDPSPDVLYDQVRFEKKTLPSLEAIQWNDFPTGGTLDFSGLHWRVKGPGYYGPGPNLFSNAADAVWVDAQGRLHLTIRPVGASWYSTEVALTDTLGYGDYVFTTVGRLDTFDPTTVLGLFLWEYGPCWDEGFLWWNPANEFDIEFGRWGSAANPDAQFVAQPADYPGNRVRWNETFVDGERTTHAFRWLADRVECRSWRGGPGDESPATTVLSWTYRGPHIPRPDRPRVHLNLWQCAGAPAAPQEAVIESFRYVSADPALVGAPPLRAAPPRVALAVLGANPGRGGARLRFSLPADAAARVTLLDVTGRAVRTLFAGRAAAGAHELAWDARDGAGRAAPAGLYFARLEAGRERAVARLLLLR